MYRGRAGEEPVGRALHERADHLVPVVVAHPVEGGHELVGGVERERRHARIPVAGGAGADARLLGEDHHGALRRVADELAVANDGIGREDAANEVRVEPDLALARGARDPPLEAVTGSR